MADFGQVQLPNPQVGLQNYLQYPIIQAQIAGEQAKTEAAQLANTYTRALQPAQIQVGVDSLRGFSDPGNGTPSTASDTGQGTLAGYVGGQAPASAPAGGQPPSGSMLTGATPRSADSAAQQLVGRTAAQMGVNPDWAMRVQHAESGTYPNSMAAISPAKARGTMQLMPGTAQDLGVNPDDPAQNVRGGVTYLAQMKQKFGDPVLATAAYNAGPARVDAFLSGQRSLPPETVNYVGKVFGNGDGMSLINASLSGAHGHPIGGVMPAGVSPAPTDPSQRPGAGVGLEPVQNDPAARNAVRQLVMMGRYYMSMPEGKGARAAAAIQGQLDNIAGPGGIVDPNTGNVYRVPGSFATRYAAANATEAGKNGPAAALHVQNTQTDLNRTLQMPMQVAPGHQVITPAAVGVGAPVTPPGVTPSGVAPPSSGIPSGGVQIPPPAAVQAPLPGQAPPMPPGNAPGPVPVAPPQAAGRPGVYTAPPVPPEQIAAAKDAELMTAGQEPIIRQAAESQSALNRIAQARAAMQQASEAGLPPGRFAGALAQTAAAAKSLGINLEPFGVKPGAVPNEQVAREALIQINGEILKRMFPQRITNADVAQFGSNLANYGMDPAALEPILGAAQQAAQYDVTKAHHLLDYKTANHGSLIGWDGAFYRQHGFGPDLFDAVRSGTVPGANGANGAKPGAATPAQAPQPAASGQPAVAPPSVAVDHLRQNPALAAAFDQKYGPGSAARVLGR